MIGAARKLAGRPLLELSVEDVERLAESIAEKKSKSIATVLAMYYRVHGMRDHADALRGIRDNARRLGLDEVLTPEDVGRLISASKNLRDRAIIATLAATGARISEVLNLRLKDLRPANGDGYQSWFRATKVRGQERFSPKIDGLYARHLEAWLRAHPRREDGDAYLFTNPVDPDGPLDPHGVAKMLARLGRLAGIRKPVNPHAFRHARVTWGIIRGEDLGRLSIGIWGKPMSQMLNRYGHYNNADVKFGEMDVPVSLNLPPVPPLPPFEAQEKLAQRIREEVRAELLEEFRRVGVLPKVRELLKGPSSPGKGVGRK